MEKMKQNGPGLLLCLAIAVPCWLLSSLPALKVVGGPVLAILAGMVLSVFWRDKNRLQPGIAYTSKKILQYAVILLGFGLNLGTIFATGRQSLPIILATITTSLVISYVLCRALRIPSKISVLIGVGSSICGGSAIAATAPVIEADNEEIAQSISVIFFFNVIAALIFPTLGGLLGFDPAGDSFGIFAGTAINDTSSVTAAASSWDSIYGLGSRTLDTAVTVKLTRTLAIIPITLALAFYRMRRTLQDSGKENKVSIRKIFPMFILYFVLASLITTVAAAFGIPETLFSPLKTLSKFFIVMAMAAVGLNTNLVKLIRTGGKPLFLGLCCWIGIAGVSLAAQNAMGLW